MEAPNGATAPLGVEVSFGTGLWLLWAAFGVNMLSLLPYFVRLVPSANSLTQKLISSSAVSLTDHGIDGIDDPICFL